MDKEKTSEQIKDAIDSLELKLKKQGFSEKDITDLKLDLEVGIHNDANLADIISIINETGRKVLEKKSKKNQKSEDSTKKLIFDVDDIKGNYSVEEFEDDLEREILEEEGHMEAPKFIEEKIQANSSYFSQKANENTPNTAYMQNEEHHYQSGGPATGPSVEQAVSLAQEQEKQDIAYKSMGKVRKKETHVESTSPSDAYR